MLFFLAVQPKVEYYIRVFEPYRETYKANNEHMTMVKSTYANSSLQEFREAVDKYKGMTDDFEAIPSCATVRRDAHRALEGRYELVFQGR